MLATAWKWVDDKTLDLTIRDGVTFHNGDPFSADDVVFTFEYTLDPKSKIVNKNNVDWVESATKTDAHTVRLKLKQTFPAAFEYLAGTIQILPKAYFQKVGLDGFTKKPVGSGPYRITEITGSSGLKMEKFAGYWKGSPLGEAHISKLQFRVIPDADTLLAELMTGGVDWAWRLPSDQADQMKKNPALTVVNGETMRVASLIFDSRGLSSPNSPMKDKRVRQAISYGIDRQAMVDNLVRGKSTVMNAFCFSEQFGCGQNVVRKYSFDLAKAKALLAEAGYPNGFDTEIWAYRERDYAEALVGYLRAMGIRAKLNFVKYPALREAIWAGRVPIYFIAWGSSSIYDVSAATSVYFEGSNDDMAKDPAVIAALKAGDSALDPAERIKHYTVAHQRIAEEAFAFPLFSYSLNYAFSKDLNFKPYTDEMPRFYESTWK